MFTRMFLRFRHSGSTINIKILVLPFVHTGFLLLLLLCVLCGGGRLGRRTPDETLVVGEESFFFHVLCSYSVVLLCSVLQHLHVRGRCGVVIRTIVVFAMVMVMVVRVCEQVPSCRRYRVLGPGCSFGTVALPPSPDGSEHTCSILRVALHVFPRRSAALCSLIPTRSFTLHGASCSSGAS